VAYPHPGPTTRFILCSAGAAALTAETWDMGQCIFPTHQLSDFKISTSGNRGDQRIPWRDLGRR